MKLIQITAALAFLATASMADSDPKYSDPSVILADLKEQVAICQDMEKGQTNIEIFGITFTRGSDGDDGDTCRFSNGELDDQVRIFLQDQSLTWAGVVGRHGLWVKVTDKLD